MASFYTLTKEYNCYEQLKKYEVIGVSYSYKALIDTARRLAEECVKKGDPWFNDLSCPDFDISDWRTNKHLTVLKNENTYIVESKYYTQEEASICYCVSGMSTCTYIFEEK